jgi:hypothetical protein
MDAAWRSWKSETRNPEPETRKKSESRIIGTTTSREGRRGREELGTAEYAEYAEGDPLHGPMTNTPKEISSICV